MLSEVPEGWEKARIDAVLQRNTNSVSVKELAAEGLVAHYSLPAFDANKKPVIESGSEIKSNKTAIDKDCLLFSKLNPRIPRVWRVRHSGEQKPVCSTEFWALKPKTGEVNLSYAEYFLGWNGFLSHPTIKPASSTNSHQRVDRKAFDAFMLPLPPLNEQHRIAEILSSVDASIQATQSVIEHAERVKRGFVRARILGGLTPEEIFEGEAPENSELKTIAQATENLNKRRIPIKKSERQGGEYPYYGATGIIDYVKDYIFDERILLISEDGANLVDRNYPIAYSVEGKTWVNNHAHVLKVDSPAQQKVLEEFFNEVPLTKFLTGMAQPKLNKAALSAIPVPVFSETEATVLAEAIAALDASIASNRESITQLQTVKNGLMDDLLTGKVRTV